MSSKINDTVPHRAGSAGKWSFPLRQQSEVCVAGDGVNLLEAVFGGSRTTRAPAYEYIHTRREANMTLSAHTSHDGDTMRKAPRTPELNNDEHEHEHYDDPDHDHDHGHDYEQTGS
jgi:hypothetical protein